MGQRAMKERGGETLDFTQKLREQLLKKRATLQAEMDDVNSKLAWLSFSHTPINKENGERYPYNDFWILKDEFKK